MCACVCVCMFIYIQHVSNTPALKKTCTVEIVCHGQEPEFPLLQILRGHGFIWKCLSTLGRWTRLSKA